MGEHGKAIAIGGAILTAIALAVGGCGGCSGNGGSGGANKPYHMDEHDIQQIERAAILRGHNDEAAKQFEAGQR
jgi:hypothetical protein